MARSSKTATSSLATRKAMKRRSQASVKSNKRPPHKASKPKRGPAPHEASRPVASTVGNDEQIAKLTHERNEALEQRAATTE
jgi:hypothetical protein